MKCPNCGNEITAGSFCAVCGTKVEIQEKDGEKIAIDVEAEAIKEKEKKENRLGIKGVLVFVTIAIIVQFFWHMVGAGLLFVVAIYCFYACFMDSDKEYNMAERVIMFFLAIPVLVLGAFFWGKWTTGDSAFSNLCRWFYFLIKYRVTDMDQVSQVLKTDCLMMLSVLR